MQGSHQSFLKHGRRTFVARWKNWYAAGNFGQKRLRSSFAVIRSDSESIFQQQFSEYHGYDGCYSIYFDSSTQVYYKKSRMTILGLAGVLFCENEQRHIQNGLSYVPKKILGCSGKLGEDLKQQQVTE